MRLSAILDITYEGNGMFKIYPPPLDADAREILAALNTFAGTGQVENDEKEIESIKDNVEEAISDIERALYDLRRSIE